jgi:ATP adenylyltransferase
MSAGRARPRSTPSARSSGRAVRVLWAPWRMAYIGGPRKRSCIFCAGARGRNPRAALVLARTREALVMLNRYPYANGHLMVAPRRHTADLPALERPLYRELMDVLQRSTAIISEVFQPEGMNVGINLGRAAGAGIADHLHWHVVPRWNGDTNFMPMIAEVRVIPEHLEAVYERLRPRFAELE